ncbi:MAG: cytochrome c oxidase assembly protein [Ahrensia sp.]|nr:cytochrome c oxidase assembly protein [Ahrensia sp.]
MTEQTANAKGNRRNGLIAAIGLGIVFGMVGMAYASVPLYRIFCQVTGYGGTTQRAQSAGIQVLDQTIKVRFDANVSPGVNWDFRPNQRQVELRIGETMQVGYTAHNNSSRDVTGTATFNVTPQSAGAYFNKVECFCFTEQTLQPGETADMPIVFFIDPDIVKSEELKDIDTLTLSYTFFPVDEPKPVAQSDVNADVTRTIQ